MNHNNNQDQQLNNNNNSVILIGLYTLFGLAIAADCLLYSIGLLYLPVSTYSLICASQLGFNALFAFFLKAQKFTPCVINSIFLLTTSSILLVFHRDHNHHSSQTMKTHHHHDSSTTYMIGFICTVAASAGFGLLLPLTQLAFHKIVMKRSSSTSTTAMLDMLISQSFVASVVVTVGLFGSGDWKKLKMEMNDYELGKLAYLMVLIWTALAWQFYSIGSLKLIIEVSSLFSNVISTLGLPVVPVLAVFIFGEEMDGTKGVALVLAIWGFLSYAYQCYLDDKKMSTTTTSGEVGDHQQMIT